MAGSLHDAITYVLDHYVEARTGERIGKSSPTWRRVMELPGLLRETESLRERPRLVVKASAGHGSWARIPWLAVMDPEVTTTTRSGYYVIWLFRVDMSGVYLTLNQGVAEPLGRLGKDVGLATVRERAAALREKAADLADAGFELLQAIDLRSDFSTATHYTASTVAHRLYERDSLPDDAVLLEDAERVLAVYERLARER